MREAIKNSLERRDFYLSGQITRYDEASFAPKYHAHEKGELNHGQEQLKITSTDPPL
jgi:hypothetical protein